MVRESSGRSPKEPTDQGSERNRDLFSQNGRTDSKGHFKDQEPSIEMIRHPKRTQEEDRGFSLNKIRGILEV